MFLYLFDFILIYILFIYIYYLYILHLYITYVDNTSVYKCGEFQPSTTDFSYFSRGKSLGQSPYFTHRGRQKSSQRLLGFCSNLEGYK